MTILHFSIGIARYSNMFITLSKSPSLKSCIFLNFVEIALGSSSFWMTSLSISLSLSFLLLFTVLTSSWNMLYISLTSSNFFKILTLNSFVKDLNFLFCLFCTLKISNFPRLVFSVWNMSSSKSKSPFGVGGSGGFLVGFGGLSRNCFGGNMMSSLTLFRGTGLGLMLSHFPVLGGGIGLIIS